jgi:Ran GTPase-activating protein (RanGAP) involved in mRNA processing and transport
MDELLPILEKRNQIKELHIIDCRVSRQASRSLLACIKDHDNLRKLSLSKINLPPICVQNLCAYLESSNKLFYLDLSYNGLMA